MPEVSVKVKVKISKDKKKRKKRSDAGIKRVKKGTKNPQFQTGSIDFRTIGTQQSSNATLLTGLIASRAVVPQYLQPQPQQPISTELAKYAPRDLPRNVPPPQFRPDSEQGQEEVSQATQVRQAMGERIGRLRKQAEDLEEKEAILFVKSKGLERRNLQMEEQGKKLQEELTTSSKKLMEQQDVLSEQRKELISGVNAIQAQGLKKLLNDKGIEPSSETEKMRVQYLESFGFKNNEDFKSELKKGRGGGVNVMVPIEKQDLQRAQEERPVQEAAAELASLQPVEPVEPIISSSSLAQAAATAQQLQEPEKPKSKSLKSLKEMEMSELVKFEKKYKTVKPDASRLKMVQNEIRRREENFGQEKSDY